MKKPWWGDKHRAGGSLEEVAGMGWHDGAAGVPSACLWPGPFSWMAQVLGCVLGRR